MLQHPKGLPGKLLRTQRQLMMQQLRPQWRPTMPLRPQRWLKTQHCPQRLSFRHLALVVGGGGGRLPLPHMAWRPFQSPLLARRPSLSRPSASPCRRRPSASPCRRRPSSSPCQRRPSASPCRRRPCASPCRRRPCASPCRRRPCASPCRRRPCASSCRRLSSASPCRCHPGFLSCRAHPGSLPSSWLPPGLLTG